MTKLTRAQQRRKNIITLRRRLSFLEQRVTEVAPRDGASYDMQEIKALTDAIGALEREGVNIPSNVE